jgi:N-formylglutamate amidohydrolase
MSVPPYDLYPATAPRSCVVYSSPHSGRDYPAEFLARSVLDAQVIRSSEDAFVDQLFADAPRYGAPLLAARAPRAWLDLNRARDELDPAVIADAPRPALNPRISAGLGVIPRVVSNGRAIYSGKISLAEAEARIASHWVPYHARVQALMAEAVALHGRAMLIDCHSMPHEAIDTYSTAGRVKPQVVLGDRYGAAAASEIVDQIEAAFVAEGLRVARNAPFAGAYITQAYGRPSRGQHVVQIEIDRALYMDEATVTPHGGFEAFRAVINRVMAVVGRDRDQVPLAAE